MWKEVVVCKRCLDVRRERGLGGELRLVGAEWWSDVWGGDASGFVCLNTIQSRVRGTFVDGRIIAALGYYVAWSTVNSLL